jgi:hypothetical protein
MLSAINNYYLQQEEPLKLMLLALRKVILDFDEDIKEEWKYGMPFFYYKKKMFCYIWQHKKYKCPYIGIVEGHRIDHPLLLAEKRARMKIFLLDIEKDIPVETLYEIFSEAKGYYGR